MPEFLRPTFVANRVEELPDRPDVLEGIKLVAFDVDGTLTEHHGKPDQSVINMLHVLGGRGLGLSIISNAYGERVEELEEIFEPHDVRVYTPASIARRGERVKRYRKPNPAMLDRAALDHGLHIDRVLMVGDQLLKDVSSANRTNARSLLVPRRGQGDDIRVRLLQRPVEAAVRAWLKIDFDAERERVQ